MKNLATVRTRILGLSLYFFPQQRNSIKLVWRLDSEQKEYLFSSQLIQKKIQNSIIERLEMNSPQDIFF